MRATANAIAAEYNHPVDTCECDVADAESVERAFAVAREAITLLTDPVATARMRAGLAAVRLKLGTPGASQRAAESILQVMGAS